MAVTTAVDSLIAPTAAVDSAGVRRLYPHLYYTEGHGLGGHHSTAGLLCYATCDSYQHATVLIKNLTSWVSKRGCCQQPHLELVGKSAASRQGLLVIAKLEFTWPALPLTDEFRLSLVSLGGARLARGGSEPGCQGVAAVGGPFPKFAGVPACMWHEREGRRHGSADGQRSAVAWQSAH